MSGEHVRDVGRPRCLDGLTVRVYDLGPEPAYHEDRRLFGPWRRYEARLANDPPVHGTGWSVFEALYVLVANNGQAFQERWPAVPADVSEGHGDGAAG